MLVQSIVGYLNFVFVSHHYAPEVTDTLKHAKTKPSNHRISKKKKKEHRDNCYFVPLLGNIMLNVSLNAIGRDGCNLQRVTIEMVV